MSNSYGDEQGSVEVQTSTINADPFARERKKLKKMQMGIYDEEGTNNFEEYTKPNSLKQTPDWLKHNSDTPARFKNNLSKRNTPLQVARENLTAAQAAKAITFGTPIPLPPKNQRIIKSMRDINQAIHEEEERQIRKKVAQESAEGFLVITKGNSNFYTHRQRKKKIKSHTLP